MADTRKRALASIVVHSEIAPGDPIITDPGFSWIEELAKSYQSGTYQLDSLGRPLTEWLPDQGLTCRPFRVAKDTRLAKWTFSGGSWEEERPACAPLVYNVTQYDSTPGVQGVGTSTDTVPVDPNFAFSLILEDTPSDWDTAALPPFVRLEFGGVWGVHFEKGGAYLFRKIAGTWSAVLELDSPPHGAGLEDLERFWVWVRVIDGQIGVSMDEGRNYKWFAAGGSVAPAKAVLRTQGSTVTFGWGQLVQNEGWFEPQDRNTTRIRLAPTPSFAGDYWAPSGVPAPTFTDRSTPASMLARWRATITPTATATGFGWSFYSASVLRCVTMKYPVTTTFPTLDTSTPWDNYLEKVTVSKGEALDCSSATIQLSVSAFLAFDWTRFRERKLSIQLGHVDTSDAPSLQTVFTGYIRAIYLVWDVWGQVSIQIAAENAAWLLRRSWDRTQLRALGGQTLNAAADEVLATESGTTSIALYRSWHALGNTILLPRGRWQELADLVQPGELKWETLTRLFGRYGLDTLVGDDGVYATVLAYVGGLPYVSGTTWTKRFVQTPTSELRDLPRQASRRLDWGEMATTVQIAGTLADGSLGLAQAEDADALDPLLADVTGRYVNRRRVHVEEISGSTDLTALTLRSQARARELMPAADDLELSLPVDLRVGRKDLVYLYDGSPLRISDGTPFVVSTLRHEYEVQKTFGELETVAGLKRWQ